MSKIQDMINETQNQLEQTRQQLNQLIQQKQQIDQAIEQGTHQYQALNVRLNTLQEVDRLAQNEDFFRTEETSDASQSPEQTANQSLPAAEEERKEE